MSVVSSNILAGASGNQGSSSYEIKKGLRFNSGDSAYMSRTPGTAGNRRTWTWSGWVKRSGNNRTVIFAGGATTSDTGFASIEIETDGTLRVIGWSTIWCKSLPVYRDYSAWYHIVVAFDTTQANASDQIKVYVNGEQIAKATETAIAQNTECGINQTALHAIGGLTAGTLNTSFTNFYASDVHFIDGSALSPTDFGEFDTNGVWQPKKVTEAALITAKESQQPYDTRDNMAQEWSGGTISGSPYNANHAWSIIFNGDPLNNIGATSTGSGTNPYTLAIPSVSFSTLTLYTQSGNANGIWVNGNLINCSGNTVYGSGLDSQTVGTITFTSSQLGFSTLTELGANGQNRWFGIAVDGRLLADGPADNSQLWSNKVSPTSQIYIGTPEMAFNGSLSTSAGGGFAFQANQEITLLTGESISASTLKVHANVSSSATFRVNGSTVTDDADGTSKWITLSGWSSPITSLSIEDTYQSTCRGVEIDGKILVDSPSQFNAGKTWSKYLTSPAGFNSGRYPDRAFVGTDSSDFAATPANVSGESNAIEFTPPTTIAYSTLEVRGRGTDQTTFSVKIDTGSGYGSAITSTGDKWQTIALSGTLTKLKLWTTSFAGENELGGIRIDGKALVDGGWGTNGFHLPFDDGTDIGKDTAVTAPALDPRGGFDAVTYTGNGTYNQVTGLRFAPDLVWIKNRDDVNGWHQWRDTIRGGDWNLASNSSNDESDASTKNLLFNPDGFSLTGTTGSTDDNKSGDNYIAWAWKAGGTAVSNTDGTVTSTVSADQNYGFSVVQFDVGTPSYTVGHGLGSEPKFMIFKSKSSNSTNWNVYHVSTGNQSRSYLNLTNAASSGEACWNSTSPTSSVFSMGNSGEFSGTMIAYCWSEVAGFSKFGTFTGSGSAGHSITTGFKPAFVMVKRTTNISGSHMGWSIVDNARGSDKKMQANNSAAENDGTINAASPNDDVTFQDDGFTLASSASATNGSGETYIYAAFADYPGNNFTAQNLTTEENTASKNNFGAFTWTGNSTAGTVIDTGFQPDLVWVKDRGTTDVAGLFDSVRGSTKYLIPSTTGQEGTDANAITSFTSSGFTLGTGYTSITTNYSGRNLVGWAWKAGGAASANTDGNVTAQVSANPNFGFSICNYTVGENATNTIGHGLTKPPEFIILKEEDQTNHWQVYHKALGNAKVIYLDLTNGNSPNTVWNSTSPTSSVFTVQSGGSSNAWNNKTQIAYCWHSVDGYSRFSSYVGNGSSTGPVIDCGFAPAFLLIKADIAGEDWTMHDSKRGSQNIFFANTSAAEMSSSAYDVEFTGTGFQIKNTNPRFNTSGSTYLFAAFAEPTYSDLDLVNDTPTTNAEDPVKGNYCTLNAVDENSCTFSNGNLGVTVGSNSCCRGTVWPSSGKWYFEFDITSYGNPYVGIASHGSGLNSYTSDNSIAINNVGNIFNRENGTLSYPGESLTLNSTGSYMCAFDLDYGKIWWGKDGTWYAFDNSTANVKTTVAQVEAGNDAYEFSTHPNFGKEWTVSIGTSSNSSAYTFNAGQQPFKYTPPSGYKKLCTTNLSDPTIEDGRKHFDAKLWSGTGTSTRTISGYEFSPDFLWIKQRNQTYSVGHQLYDILRGVGSLKQLDSSNNTAEGGGNTDQYGYVSSLDSSGFSVAEGSAGSSDYVNLIGATYVAWSWDAGSSNTSISVGGLNSSIYDQTSTWSNTLTVAVDQDQTWSNYLTSSTGSFSGAATNAFDNSHSNANTSTAYPTGANESVTFDISALSENLTGELEVFTWCDDSTAATKYTQIQVFEGGSSTASFTGNAHKVNTDNYQWCAPLGVFTNITKIIVSGINAGGAYFGGVSVNGIELVDNGVSVTGFASGYPATAAFNGVNDSGGGAARTNSPPNGIKYKHPTSLTVTTLEMKCYYSNTIWLPNGTKTSVAANSGNDVWHQVPIGSGFTFDGSNYLTIEREGSANYTYLDGIRLNGKELVDTGVSLGNVPTLASTVRANPSAGFSVVTYSGNSTSGATVGHGLNAPPELVIVKARNTAQGWCVYHESLGATKYLPLETAGAPSTYAGAWNNTAPTSSVFSLGNDNIVNTGYDYVAYCFNSVAGYSKIGKYEGNGTTDNAFVYCGFRPKFVLFRNTSTHGGDWILLDTSRRPNGPTGGTLVANVANAEDGYYTSSQVNFDFLSNGFKIRHNGSPGGDSGRIYIYLAIAENPFKQARAY